MSTIDLPHAAPARSRALRWTVAAVILMLAALCACLVIVSPGEGVVVTRFGRPVRVLLTPGASLRWPLPIEATVPVDLRLRTTSSGLQDVGTRDGLRVLVQAYVVWSVPARADTAERFLRSVQNDPDVAASQLRSLMASSLEITASRFDLAQLVNTDPAKVRIDDFEARLRGLLGEQARRVYGVDVRQVGIERLTLSAEALQATIDRMKAERDTVAAQRSAEGQREAAKIVSEAERDARITLAGAKAEAASIEADAQTRSTTIYQQAYRTDPKLYTMLRSFDTMDAAVGPGTRIVLRTDAAPFRMLVDGPSAGQGPKKP
ncbi:protease modulator HflC [Luteibacter sp. PPL201]|uniref:Protein HflC n=1 Tax=Luteibacter sahnii TaxID=3021977 RepID=A0ABT6BEJ6_9GAMM|nr:protease modulator HflC [Luteibacter sp. PPL193]MDY1547581.1 protease modulator HflC [Luteibacter sp. PPL193]